MTLRTLACTLLLLPSASSALELEVSSGGAATFGGKEMVFELPKKVPSGLTAAQVESAAKSALAAWSAAARLKLSAAPVEGETVSGTVSFVEKDWPYDANALATTDRRIDKTAHRILRADIKLNAQSHRFRVLPADSTAGGIYDDLQSALTHELGHAIGLEHSLLQGAVMYPSSAKGDVAKRVLSAEDIAGASALYGAPVDLPGPAAAMQGLAEGMATVGCSTAPSGSLIFASLFALLGFAAVGRRATAPVRASGRRAERR